MSATMDHDAAIDHAPVDEDLEGTDGSGGQNGASGRRIWWIIGVAAIVVAVTVGILFLANGGDPDAASQVSSPNTAEVVRTDLIEVESYDATLGTLAADPITSQLSGTITSALASGETAVSGDVIFAVDGEPVVLMYGAAPGWRAMAPTEDTRAFVNRRAGTVTAVVDAGTTLEEGDVAYWVDGEPVVVLYGDVPAYRTMADVSTDLEGVDILQLETYLDDAGYNDASMAVDGEYTAATESVVENWEEDIGATVDGVVALGDVVFVPGPVDVTSAEVEVGDLVTVGSTVMTLAGETVMEGVDIAQLQDNLAALGFDADGALTSSGRFDEVTKRAVEAWQLAVGADVDGVVDLGEVVFVSGPVRIGDRLAAPGSLVARGAPVLAVSSADKVVTLELPAEDQNLLEIGTLVVVELPDGTDVPATVTDIATVASVNLQGSAVFEVTIGLDDAAAAAGLDEAPVEVEIVTDSVENVLAVPVTALLALAEGGYAVEVVTAAAGTRLVGVEPGFFAGGLVEIRAAGIDAGDRVVVP